MMNMQQPFSHKDEADLKARNLTSSGMAKYRHNMENGFPWMSLSRNCQPGQEIKILESAEANRLVSLYKGIKDAKILKFVPASGAASRMFKELHQALIAENPNGTIEKFSSNLDQFAFSKALLDLSGGDRSNSKILISNLLSDEGLNYAALPKGSILFHKYVNGEVRTAFEEHFYEAAAYARSGENCHLHFTVPLAFESQLTDYLNDLGKCLNVALKTNFKVETSVQKCATDSPAIYSNSGEWVRGANDALFFRPAGHGALLDNINELDADIVFVKNIDNVVNENHKAATTLNKQRLGGVLIHVQTALFEFLNAIDTGTLNRESCKDFMSEWLSTDCTNLPENELRNLLNRPIRICGMVKNEGEPGGGPFMVKDGDGESLQIVEKAQVNVADAEQNSLLGQATHFNPVDLVLAVKNYKGQSFDLKQFSNSNTGMVVEKSYQGKSIKALELPGLWNGAMHNWNTVFVEVPLETFNPVKTVFDLLRPAHS